MLTIMKRSWIFGAAFSLLLTGLGASGAGPFTASPALAQDYRHDDHDRDRDRDRGRRNFHPDYRPTPVYAPPAVVIGLPGPSPAIDFVFPISIR
jgi:hypothetical protein